MSPGRSTYGINQHSGGRVPLGAAPEESNEEGVGLIAHAQDNPHSRAPSPFNEYEAEPYESDLGYRGAAGQQFHHHQQQGPISYEPQPMAYQDHHQPIQPGRALSTDDYYQSPPPPVNMAVYSGRDEGAAYPARDEEAATGVPRDDAQRTIGAALWGQNPHQHPSGPMI